MTMGNLASALDRVAVILDARDMAIEQLTTAYSEITTGDRAIGLRLMADSILLLQANQAELRQARRRARHLDIQAGQRRIPGV